MVLIDKGTCLYGCCSWFRQILFPAQPRSLPYARAWNITFRTAHIAAIGILLGGHAFDVAEVRLRGALYASIATGLLLTGVEAYPSGRWLYQGRGVLVMVKIALLCLIPWLWEYRLLILLVVVIIASVGSHVPGRFRYYSIIHRRVLE